MIADGSIWSNQEFISELFKARQYDVIEVLLQEQQIVCMELIKKLITDREYCHYNYTAILDFSSHAAPVLWRDRDFLKTWFKDAGKFFIEDKHDFLKMEKEIFLWIAQYGGWTGRQFQKADPVLLQDRTFVKEALKVNDGLIFVEFRIFDSMSQEFSPSIYCRSGSQIYVSFQLPLWVTMKSVTPVSGCPLGDDNDASCQPSCPFVPKVSEPPTTYITMAGSKPIWQLSQWKILKIQLPIPTCQWQRRWYVYVEHPWMGVHNQTNKYNNSSPPNSPKSHQNLHFPEGHWPSRSTDLFALAIMGAKFPPLNMLNKSTPPIRHRRWNLRVLSKSTTKKTRKKKKQKLMPMMG